MVNVIPHSEVVVRYTTSGGAVALPSYYGVLTAPLKDLHKFHRRVEDYSWNISTLGLSTETQDFYTPESSESRLLNSSDEFVYYTSLDGSKSGSYPYPELNSTYFTPDAGTVLFAFDNILYKHSQQASLAGKKLFYYADEDYQFNKLMVADAVSVDTDTGDNTELVAAEVAAQSFALAGGSYKLGTAFIIYEDSTNKRAIFAVPVTEVSGINILAASESKYKLNGDAVIPSSCQLSVSVNESGVITVGGVETDNLPSSSGVKLAYIATADVVTLVDFDSIADQKWAYLGFGASTDYEFLKNAYADEVTSAKQNVWDSNKCLANVTISEVSNTLNFSSMEGVIKGSISKFDYDSDDFGFSLYALGYRELSSDYILDRTDEIGTVASSAITYTNVKNAIKASDNVLFAKVHVEYNADLTSEAYLNKVYRTDLLESSLPFDLGKTHPENPLGFAKYITDLFSGSQKYYVCIAESKQKAFETIEKHRNLVFVANVWDDFGTSYNEGSWLTNRQTNKSDYRLLFTWKAFSNKIFKMGTDLAWNSSTITISSGSDFGSVTDSPITAGVEAGDAIQIEFADGSWIDDTILSVSSNSINFAKNLSLEGYDLDTYSWVSNVKSSGTDIGALTPFHGDRYLFGYKGTNAITVADHTSNTITVTSNLNTDVKSGDYIFITGSTANNGFYKVLTDATSDTHSEIALDTTFKSLVDSTADGTIYYVAAGETWALGQASHTASRLFQYSSLTDWALSGNSNNDAVLVEDTEISYKYTTSTGLWTVMEASFNFRVYDSLTASEVSAAEVTNQTDTEPDLVKVFNKSIKWANSYISNKWFVPVILGQKIVLPEQKPLSNVGLDSGNFDDVFGAYEYYSEDELDALVGAGYFIYAIEPGTNVFALREATCGLKTGDVFRGNLNAVTPVVTFASSVYKLTKAYLGQYNITEETKDMVKLAAQSLCNSYTSKPVAYLGTRLANCVIDKVEEITDGIKITYKVTPQRSLNVIQNEVIVTE